MFILCTVCNAIVKYMHVYLIKKFIWGCKLIIGGGDQVKLCTDFVQGFEFLQNNCTDIMKEKQFVFFDLFLLLYFYIYRITGFFFLATSKISGFSINLVM
jgi:hypothetical protein